MFSGRKFGRLLCFLAIFSAALTMFVVLNWVDELTVIMDQYKIMGTIKDNQDFTKNETLNSNYYLVNTSTCKIIYMNEWDQSILPYFKPHDGRWPVECQKRSRRHWTYVENSNIVINESALHATGFSFNEILCCYKGILRIHNETKEVTVVRFTAECFPMTERSTPVQLEFIRVVCTSTRFPAPFGHILYKQFHPIAIPEVTPSRKSQHWTDSKKEYLRSKPPNVIMLGIDTLSRLNFRRTMTETRKTLERMGAIEFLGYTKVGESTHANLVALLSGYDSTALSSLCHHGGQFSTPSDTEDLCPYLWKDFDAANYTTSLIEDRINMAFGYLYGKGYIQKPTDYYFLPFMLGVYNHQPYYQMKRHPKPNAMDCVDHKTVDQVILEYVRNLMNMTEPLFIFMWNLNLAHEDLLAPKNADELYNWFLIEQEMHLQNNTVFLFLSDHGSRYGPLRETLMEWYEDKLPALWIYLSPDIREARPEWYENLQINSRKLTSPFDLHLALVDILETFTPHRIKSPQTKRYGSSLLSTIIPDNRTCPHAGIPASFCPCSLPQAVSIDLYKERLELCAKEALNRLNYKLQTHNRCAPLSLDKIKSGAILEEKLARDNYINYIITFSAKPGDILIKANVFYDESRKTYESKTDPSRINSMTRSSNCINDNVLEKFCYCS